MTAQQHAHQWNNSPREHSTQAENADNRAQHTDYNVQVND
jgi:uncharacterized MAPEG superfamily protein